MADLSKHPIPKMRASTWIEGMKTHSHGLLLLVSAALAVLAPHSLAGDLFVGAGHPFSEIDPAIAAAAPGDRIFVDSGTFLPFDLTKAAEITPAATRLSNPARLMF